MNELMIIEEVVDMDYLDYKAKILYQIGLTDFEEVKKHLEKKCYNATTEIKKRIQIDNASRKLMNDYYNGDRTFVAVDENAKYFHKQLKMHYPKMETLYEDAIIRCIGKMGFNLLLEANFIEACGMFDGRKLYAI